MPELPEVETSCRGIAPAMENQVIQEVITRIKKLRWPIPKNINAKLKNKKIISIERKAKYILLHTNNGTLIIHLGMSGSLRIIKNNEPASKHDHVDILLNNNLALRLRDPRKFGCFLWTKNYLKHPLLCNLGIEPLSNLFNGEYLYKKSRKRKISIKQFIMNNLIVVGIGNIYASEALFLSGINPKIVAGKISIKRMNKLSASIKNVLKKAITAGGTTLRDFQKGDGTPGYFKIQLNVYDRKDKPCRICRTKISLIKQGQRATYYCKNCQK